MTRPAIIIAVVLAVAAVFVLVGAFCVLIEDFTPRLWLLELLR